MSTGPTRTAPEVPLLLLFTGAALAAEPDLADGVLVALASAGGEVGGGLAGGLLGWLASKPICAVSWGPPGEPPEGSYCDAMLVGIIGGVSVGTVGGGLAVGALTSRARGRRARLAIAGGVAGLAAGGVVATVQLAMAEEAEAAFWVAVIGLPVGAGIGASVAPERVALVPDFTRDGVGGLRLVGAF